MFSTNFSVIKMCILLLKMKKNNRIKWRWKSNQESWFDSLINCPWSFPPTFGKFPYTGLVWGWLFSLPFSFYACYPKSLRYPGTIIFFKWLLEAYQPAPAPNTSTLPSFSAPHILGQGGESLKSRPIRGSIHMPLACFLTFKRNKKHLHEVPCWSSLPLFPLRLLDSGDPAPQVPTCPLRPGHLLFPDFHRGSQAVGFILKGRATLPFITMATAGHQLSVVVFSRRHL